MTTRPTIARPSRELIRRYSGRGPRYTSYPPTPAWRSRVGPSEYLGALEHVRQHGKDLALYVHLPFCPKRCWYCACNVQIAPDSTPIDPYLDRLEREIALVASLVGERQVTSVHFGGGTPNMLSAEQHARLVRTLRKQFTVATGARWAIELDSRLCEPGDVARIVESGFSRVSFGVQDLDNKVGHSIGRVTGPGRLWRAVREARGAGADGVNMDLLYGLPHQTPDSLTRTLEMVCNEELRPDRLAFYGYAHVPWLRPQQRRLERSGLPDAEARLDLLIRGFDQLVGRGYEPVGMDHFALADDALARALHDGTLRRNFMGYTTVAARDLIGLGVGAIGYLRSAPQPMWVQNAGGVKSWSNRRGLTTVRGHALTPEELRTAAAIEDVLCRGTTCLEAFAAGDEQIRDAVESALSPLVADGLARLDDSLVVLTPLGRLLARTVAMAFDPAMRANPDGAARETATRYSATV